jgi:hypothetical protein
LLFRQALIVDAAEQAEETVQDRNWMWRAAGDVEVDGDVFGDSIG